MNFQNQQHFQQFHAWTLQRIATGELAETLRRRGMTINVDENTLDLLRRFDDFWQNRTRVNTTWHHHAQQDGTGGRVYEGPEYLCPMCHPRKRGL